MLPNSSFIIVQPPITHPINDAVDKTLLNELRKRVFRMKSNKERRYKGL
jgi:hypothetical protein